MKTRVELTPLGSQYMAERRLKHASEAQRKETPRKLMRRAKAALTSAQSEIEAGEVMAEA